MQERYEAIFRGMSREQAWRTYEILTRERVIPWNPVPTDGPSLYTCLRQHGIDQARVVFALGREFDQLGVGIIEHVVGKPIVRQRTSAPVLTRDGKPARASGGPSRPPPTRAEDSHVILEVAPNPKKPGSSTFERYKHWEVGITVAEAMRRGLTRADVNWDIERGFVKIGPPTSG